MDVWAVPLFESVEGMKSAIEELRIKLTTKIRYREQAIAMDNWKSILKVTKHCSTGAQAPWAKPKRVNDEPHAIETHIRRVSPVSSVFSPFNTTLFIAL